MNQQPYSAVNPHDLRGAMSRLVTGVVLATARTEEGPVGMTINSFTSITLDPATVLICLNTRNRGYEAVKEAGAYCVNILGGSHGKIAQLFATPGMSQEERFSRVEWEPRVTGAPVVTGAAAWMDCRVVDLQHRGTHGLFFGEVVAAGQDELDETPLAYYQRDMYPLVGRTH
ncbi:flavin reductase family protein [Leucobacter sp. wl10]|uniref:flavin reductase family protein n=1 Tax=Leucobacter sp. wl10 TaxID=2304677 RepID=UPI000E5AF0BE|nr:flavin reductase family protein [Leucobacter sp. wl10]RGE20050.1 flavin reductase [Leucobacter sp. wl10]